MSIQDHVDIHTATSSTTWKRAHTDFINDLTLAEKAVFQNASMETILSDMNKVDGELKGSKTKRFLDTISPFVDTINGYGSAMDVFVNIYPMVMAPLWGGIRVVLHIAHRCGSYLKNLVEMIALINEVLPRSAIYATLFGKHEKVVAAVSDAFLDVLHFCRDVKRFLRKGRVLQFKLLWTSFEKDFRFSDFQKHNKSVSSEVRLAHRIEMQQFSITSTNNQMAAKIQSAQVQTWNKGRAQQLFLETLYTYDYERHKDMVSEHAPGTCRWLLHNQSFWSWWQGHICLLFIELGPAMGKSVLARTVIDFLESDELVHIPEAKYDKTISYFFFSDEDSRRDAQAAMSALLYQLLHSHPDLLDFAFMYKKQATDHHSFSKLWNLFLGILNGPQHVNIIWIIDGLDHCEEKSRRMFLKKLDSLFSEPLARSRLKVIITGRPISSIHDDLDKSSSSRHLRFLGQNESDQHAIQSEIGSYISDRIEQFRRVRQRRVNHNDDVPHHLQNWISSKANHNYLLVCLIFEELDRNAGLSKLDLKDIVDALPVSCADFYERILSRSLHPPKAKKLLHAVVGSARPLTLDEMNYIFSIGPKQERLADVELVPGFSLARTLQELCGFFVNVRGGRIYLFHHTAKEFLLQDTSRPQPSSQSGSWKHSLSAGTSHAILARACLIFLQFKNFDIRKPHFDELLLRRDTFSDMRGFWWDDRAGDIAAVKAFSEEHPFLQYAACHWHFHLEKCDPDVLAELVPIALQICDPGSNIWKIWFGIFIVNWQKSSTIPQFKRTLDFAAWFGFHAGVNQLLQQNEYLPDQKLSALALASIRGHRNVTRLFFELESPGRNRFPNRSRAKRRQEIEAVIKQVETAFPSVPRESWIYRHASAVFVSFRRKVVRGVELADNARSFSSWCLYIAFTTLVAFFWIYLEIMGVAG